MKKLSLVTLTLCISQLLSAAKVEKDVNITVNGETRSYKLYAPNNVKDDCPLVLSLHGANGSKNDKSPFGTDVADMAGCIVVYPQGKPTPFPIGFGGTTTGWTASGEYNDDVRFLMAVIDDVAKSYKIDRKRLYCCGFSNGGMMTYALSSACSDVFAAFASISGYQMNEFHLQLTGKRPVPFLHIHGKNDTFVLYELMPKIVCQMVTRIGATPVAEKTVKSGKYTKSVFAATEGGFPYIYYEVDGMGHEPYTGNTEEGHSGKTMWNFFKQYTLDAPCDTTLKWRSGVGTEGLVAKDYGYTMNNSSYVFYYGDTPQAKGSNDKHNVYRTLQFTDGKYKLAFKSQGDASKTVTVTLQKLPISGNKNIVVSATVNVGESAVLPFEINDGWGEYRLTIKRANSKDEITLSDLTIHTVTAEEYEALSTDIRQTSLNTPVHAGSSKRYDLSGRAVVRDARGLMIEDGRMILR